MRAQAAPATVAPVARIAIVRPLHASRPRTNEMTAQTGHQPDSGTTDMTEHLKTWHGFLSFMKWQVVGAIVLLVFLAIFRTHG
jgi:hypothetical protein